MSSQPTITSLLNSLHTHLQTQTQLLPTLHAQLGLPPTALADELSSLHNALTRCIEDQISSRRKQVHELEERCENLESECHRYSAALGPSAKGLEITATELRREPILPRRYDQLAELQEKLRQLYHTKLEQLIALTSRLVAMSRIVGDGFFPEDVLDSSTSCSSGVSYQDVCPERFSRLEKELVRGKGEMSRRLNQLATVFVQIDWLHTELGIVPPTLEDLPSSSSNSLGLPPVSRPPSDMGFSLASPSDPFIRTPTPGSRSKPPLLFTSSTPDDSEDETAYQRIFARFVAQLDEADDELAGRCAGLEGVEPTPGLLAWAEATRSTLEDLQRRREAHIQAMYDQLEGLWRRLGVPDNAMDGFVDAHRGSTEETIREYEAELERMLELKRERMSAFVENARGEIAKLWDELLFSEEDQGDFTPYFDDEHTEELLLLHEDEIRRLKEERRTKAHLLPSVRKYFDICGEEKELANTASDQSRLLGRGPRDPGRLLREEKMRKRVKKEKPRLEKDLLNSIPAWEAEAGRPFLVHGESMLQILLSAAGATDKENRPGAKPRAGSVPPRMTTPNSAPGKGAVTPAVRPASSMGCSQSQSVPSKRPRLAETNGTQVPSFVPRSAGGPSAGAGHPPSKIAMPVPVRGSSVLPVHAPRAVSATIPRQHAALGIGRPPSRQARPQASSVGSARLQQASGSYSARSVGSGLGTSTSRNPQTIAVKAKRARRESFRPRPSGDWKAVSQGRYGGLEEDALKEEDEDT